MALSAKHRRFADLYFHSGKGSLSYQEVYQCAPKTANSAAYRLLQRDDIKAYLERLENRKAHVVAHHAVITEHEIEVEETKIIRRRIPEIFDENGQVKELRDWPVELQDAVKEIEFAEADTLDGDGNTVKQRYLKKVKFEDKGAALGRMEKVRGMVIDRQDIEHHGTLDVRAILADIDGMNKGKLPQDCD